MTDSEPPNASRNGRQDTPSPSPSSIALRHEFISDLDPEESLRVFEANRSEALEKDVLGSMLLDPECVGSVSSELCPDYFSSRGRMELFRAIVDFQQEHGSRMDVTLVAEKLKQRGVFDLVGGELELMRLMDRVPSSALVLEKARLVREHAVRRRYAELQSEALGLLKGQDDISSINEQFQAKVSSLLERRGDPDRLYSLDEFLSLDFPEERSFLGDQLLVEGTLAVAAGKPGVGKTWLGLQLGLSISAGVPFLGLRTNKARAGMLALELPPLRAQDRIHKILEGQTETGEFFFLPRGSHFDLSSSQERERLRSVIKRYGLQVLILDPWSRFHTADENDNQQMGEVLSQLAGIAGETRCCIVLVHHERKGLQGTHGREDAVDCLRGSSRLASDPNLILRLHEKSGSLWLTCLKCNFGSMDPICLSRSEKGPLVAREPPVAGSEVRATNRAKVIEVMRSAGMPMRRKDVQEKVSLSQNCVLGLLNDVAEKSGGNSWKLRAEFQSPT